MMLDKSRLRVERNIQCGLKGVRRRSSTWRGCSCKEVGTNSCPSRFRTRGEYVGYGI